MRLSGPLRSDCNQVRRHAFPLSTILRWPVWVHGVRSREITQARSADFLKCPSRLNPNIDVNTSGTARLWPSPESEFGKERVDLGSYLADVLRGPQFHQQRVLRLPPLSPRCYSLSTPQWDAERKVEALPDRQANSGKCLVFPEIGVHARFRSA